jgi:hypothetical protein
METQDKKDYAKADITVKFNKLPTKTQVIGKDTVFTVQDAKGYTYKITCKTKTFNKVQRTIAEFKHDYVVSCGSSDFSVNGKIIDLLQTGVQVFEKIPKPVESSPVTEQPTE